MKRALIVLYSHIESYPPSLNALQLLAKRFDHITVVHRNVMNTQWVFPDNVRLVTTRQFCHYSQVGKQSAAWKIRNLFGFAFLFWKEMRRSKPDWLIIHEPVALLCWDRMRRWIGLTPKVWYHNHDIFDGSENFLFRHAYKAQYEMFPHLHKFSIPSDDRKEFFPMHRLGGTYHFIPNYPGRYLYGNFTRSMPMDKTIRFVYQGYIAEGHGLEQFLELLRDGIPDVHQTLMLVLKGYRDEDFFKRLMSLVNEYGIGDRVEVHGISSYALVPEVASTCHIGIGIHTKTDHTNRTLGTASNKLYEYAAVGLPVIVYDNEQFRKYLGMRKWAFFTDASVNDIGSVIKEIIKGYDHYSKEAKMDFSKELNFEKYFSSATSEM